ncbi:hypothetical protein TNCV_1613851 [Trichonephila clavipes]|nr:hypothetical protein TNCV_1613851 [Trichonephila clavipes]
MWAAAGPWKPSKCASLQMAFIETTVPDACWNSWSVWTIDLGWFSKFLWTALESRGHSSQLTLATVVKAPVPNVAWPVPLASKISHVQETLRGTSIEDKRFHVLRFGSEFMCHPCYQWFKFTRSLENSHRSSKCDASK